MASVSRLEPAFRPKVPSLPADRAMSCYHFDVRRTIVAVVIVAIAGVAGALAFGALANEREFDRLIADGDAAVAAERPFQAIEAYSGAIALKPDSMLAHFKRGAVYQAQNELEAALRDFRSADRSRSRARCARSSRSATSTWPSAATSARSSATRRSSPSTSATPRVLYKLGLARYRAGRIERRDRRRCKQALAIDPAHGRSALRARPRPARSRSAAGRAQVARRSGAPLPCQPDVGARSAGGCVSAGRRLRPRDQPARSARGARAGARRSRGGGRPGAGARRPRGCGGDHAQPRRRALSRRAAGLRGARPRVADRARSAAAIAWRSTRRSKRCSRRPADRMRPARPTPSLAAPGCWRAIGWRPSARCARPSRSCRCRRMRTCSWPTSPRRDGRIQDARDALLKYATLIGDEKPLATVATQIADYSVRLGDPRSRCAGSIARSTKAGPSAALQVKLAEAAWRAGDVARAHQVIDEGLAVGARQPLAPATQAALPR